VRIPRFYFGDIHRGSTNCILLTECISLHLPTSPCLSLHLPTSPLARQHQLHPSH
jgi:hypothetical protein